MTQWTQIGRVGAGVIAMLLLTSMNAGGQTIQEWSDRAFVNINFGYQPGARTETTAGSFDLYEETATVSADLRTGGASMFDIMAGHRIWRNAAVAVGYSRYSDTIATEVTAVIPDPFEFDAPHTSSLGLENLQHREGAVHLSGAYMLPIEVPGVDTLEILVFGGPSFFSLSKDIPAGVSVIPGTSTVAEVQVRRIAESATGGHFGVDVTYRIASYGLVRNIGVGFFLRGASASVDVPEVEGGKVDLGGFSYGVGARLRF
jgi:hypothetical protein